ncbi:BTB/POZ domain-containing protein KCTD16 [Hydra vulgaris]|nr:BTB/POZ domain-containing protein KCTD16 [Hydra vulgaris]
MSIATNCNKVDASVVELNVGGKIYVTTTSTLSRYPDSLLAKLVNNPTIPTVKDFHNRIFIDRDGDLFRVILEFLRNEVLSLPGDFKEFDRLLLEANYFKINELVKELEFLELSKQKASFLTLCVRGTFAFGRDGNADVKFRKLQRIIVCGNVFLAREVFSESLNETRDPDRGDSHRYTSRFYLKHSVLEKAFDQLNAAGFKMITSASGGAGYDHDTEESKWNHFVNYTFYR